MRLFFIAVTFFSYNAYAWTLNSAQGLKFSSGAIEIKIASDTCTNAGLTPSTIDSLVKDSIAEYWSTTPTSSLELNSTGNSGIAYSNPSNANAAFAVVPTNSILVGCSNSATIFSSSTTLAVGSLSCAGPACKGIVLLNDTASTQLNSVSRDILLTTFSHELGHALGLGHTSVKEALMYYSLTAKTQKYLHQDDIDGISYLYPNSKKLGGLAGSCATVSLIDNDNDHKDDNNGLGNFIGSFALGVLIIFTFLFKREHLSFLRLILQNIF